MNESLLDNGATQARRHDRRRSRPLRDRKAGAPRSGGTADKEIVVIVEGVARVAEAAQPVDEPPGVDVGIATHGMVMELNEDLTERGEFVSTDALQEFILGAFDIQLQHVGRVEAEVVRRAAGVTVVTS